VRKKFCRGLKRSLWYGVQDIARELNPFGQRHNAKDAAPKQEVLRPVPITSGDSLRPGEFWAVDDASFELKRGECLGLIGRNGAGKTTLLKMLNGLIKPDAGRIEMRGRVGALIALGAGFNPILTGRENIFVNGAVLGFSKRELNEKLDDIIDFAELREFIDMPVQSYSSGMAVRLGFSVAAFCQPDVLLLDEVLAVGDVGFQAKCFNTLAEFRQRGTAFILVSHNMHQIARYSDRVLYLKKGSIAYSGDRDQGVQRFIADAHEADTDPAKEGTDWSRVYGSGKVVLTAARFRNTEGVEVTSINAGDAVTLEIDFERRADLDVPPVLDVVIRDREGVLYQGTNVTNGQPFLMRAPRAGRFSVSFSSLPANTDYMDFFIVVLNPKTTEVYDWKRYVRLKIRRSGTQQGRLVLAAKWRLDQEPG
jgi:lipopolysaccharide transport system ATP-binding protein